MMGLFDDLDVAPPKRVSEADDIIEVIARRVLARVMSQLPDMSPTINVPVPSVTNTPANVTVNVPENAGGEAPQVDVHVDNVALVSEFNALRTSIDKLRNLLAMPVIRTVTRDYDGRINTVIETRG